MISSAAQSREPDLALGYLEEMMAAFLQPNIMTLRGRIYAREGAKTERQNKERQNSFKARSLVTSSCYQ